jgi:type IX secretion system PorP/SprF family membrane protein
MKHYNKIFNFLCLFFLFANGALEAQNIHYAQFHHTPQLTNPAAVASTPYASLMFNMRQQWANIGDGYTTPSFAAAYPILRANQNSRRVAGIGFTVLQDRTGQNGYVKTTGGLLNYAHNVRVSGNTFVAMGVQGGYFRKSLDVANLAFGNQWQNNAFDPNAASKENMGDEGAGFMLLNTGLMVYGQNTSGQQTFNVGVALYNVNEPSTTANTFESQLSRHLIISGSVKLLDDERFAITPNARIIVQRNKGQQINAGALFHYYASRDKRTSVGLGTWYSLNNALIASFEVNMPECVVALSYDLVKSSLESSTQTGGAPEIVLAWRKAIGQKGITQFKKRK